MTPKTLQQIVIPLVTALLEKRYQYALKYRRADAPKRSYPKELTFKNLADWYEISPRTLQRWYSGEAKTTRKTAVKKRMGVDSRKELLKSRAKLKRAGGSVGRNTNKVTAHVERLKFRHGRPTWRVHTIGWSHDQLTDFVMLLAADKEYELMFTIWHPQIFSGQSKGGGGFTSSGWVSTRGKWTRAILHKWILREQLSRGEIRAIIFTRYK